MDNNNNNGESGNLRTGQPEHDAAIASIGRLTEGSADDRGDAYAELMKKEDRVLRTVNRVVNAARERVATDELITSRTLANIAMDMMRTFHLIMHDLLHARTPLALFKAVSDGPRKIYIGLLLIGIAFVVFFIESAS